MKSATEIVNAGDAGREGQLLVDELIIKAGINAFGTNVKLFVSSVLEADLIKGIKASFLIKKKNPYIVPLCSQPRGLVAWDEPNTPIHHQGSASGNRGLFQWVMIKPLLLN